MFIQNIYQRSTILYKLFYKNIYCNGPKFENLIIPYLIIFIKVNSGFMARS